MILIKKSISKEEIQALPQVLFEGRTIVIEDEKNLQKALFALSKENKTGFDTETRPSFKRGSMFKVALMQVSTPDFCFLFRLNKIGIPDGLMDFLQNPDILKIGLSLSNDYLALNRRRKFAPAGFVDLQKMVGEYGIEDMSLQKIYAILFQKKISKNQQLTNWEQDALEEKQKRYAATDAWACLKIYEYLNERKRSHDFVTEKSHEQ